MQAPKQDSKPRELVPTGNHIARLYNITYIGNIKTNYQNQDGSDKWQNKVRLTWELPTEIRKFEVKTDNGVEEVEKPMSISKEVTFSLYKSKTQTAILRTITHALIGVSLKDEEAEVFDIDQLLGKVCMLEVEHDEYQGNQYAKPVGFGSIPEGLTVPEAFNPKAIVDVNSLSKDDIDKLPEFLQEKMKGSKEYKDRFDPSEQQRKEGIQNKIDELKGSNTSSSPDTEITSSDIPF